MKPPEMTLLETLTISSILALGMTARAQRPRPVSVVTAAKGELSRKTLLQAEVWPLESTVLVPRVTGEVQAILVKEGDVVEGPKVLIEIACPDLVANFAIAEAESAEARTKVLVARNELAATQQAVKVAKARVAAAQSTEKVAEVALEMGRVNHDRSKKLHAEKAATLEELQRTQMALLRARTELAASQAATGAARATLSQCQAQVEVKRAEHARAKANSRMMDLRAHRVRVSLGFATITNPYAKARVTAQLIDPGNLVHENETRMLEIMNTDRVRIRFGVPEVEASLVKTGTPVRIIQPRSANPDVQAKVTRTTGSLAESSRTMTAEIELDNRQGRWIPGSLCQVEVLVLQLADAVTVPGRALIKSGADAWVWTVEAGKAHRVPVRTGLELGKRIQILKGLEGGEKVIVAGLAGLREGIPVKPNNPGD